MEPTVSKSTFAQKNKRKSQFNNLNIDASLMDEESAAISGVQSKNSQ